MPFKLDYPFFAISGVMMDLKFSIGNYVKTRPASIHYATSCTGSRFHTDEVVGVVGLAISDFNFNNIETQNNRYSIFLKDDDTGGELIFGQDSGHAVDLNKNISISANGDWEVHVARLNFGNRAYNVPNTAIFDMVSPFIGVPAILYREILDELERTYLLTCQRDVVMPSCLFPDDINLLPNITLTFAQGSPMKLDLTPKLYLKKLRDNVYQLLLAGLAIDPHHKGLIHVTPNYVNYTVLGHPFMKHYYTVFDYEVVVDPTIILYEAVQATDNSGGDSNTAGITVGAILLGIVVIGALAACLWAINRSRKKANDEARKDMVYGHPPIVRTIEKPVTSEIREPLYREPVIRTTQAVIT
jgi:hypothetical protein